MIKKINIQKFGLFSDYNWDSEIGNDPDKDIFKKVNIIYGRNYSGKTTLSRVFRCVETKKLHKDYQDAKFILSTNDGTIINESDLTYSKNIRVYNTDFVKDNLSWLHNEDGEILPFTLLGGDNTIIESKIKDIENELGVLDPETNSYKEGTLYFQKDKKKSEKENDKKIWDQLKNNLEGRLTQKANKEIKANSNYVKQGETYNINNINREIKEIVDQNLSCILTDEEIRRKQDTIKEEKKEPISTLPHINFNFIEYISHSKALIEKPITLSNTLANLVQDDLLQNWVNEGRSLHQDKDTCGFCGNPITVERRKQLDEHFSKESEELKQSIEKTLNSLNSLRSTIENHLISNNIKDDRFYTVLSPRYKELNNKWNEAVKVQDVRIRILEDNLNERLKNIFKPLTNVDFSEIEENLVDIKAIVGEFNTLINKNEEKSKSIEQDKSTARKLLRYNALKEFLDNIGYTSLIHIIEEAKIKAENSDKNYTEIETVISKKETEKRDLEKGLKDEGRAAEKINKHLADFFGHDGLKLEPSEIPNGSEIKTRFVIKRGENEAKNMSEGECSLIAFCYFMAKIEDELQDPNAKDNLIIYIDDPISSLDNSHVFFMFGLIESILIPQIPVLDNQQLDFPKYELKILQLFISTHNLDFLKYLYNLRNFRGSYKEYSSNVIHLLIEKQKKDEVYRSILMPMPKHMRQNITEYVYCFSEIYKVAEYKNDTNRRRFYEENYTTLFNIGNNMRKFLEGFLAFKCAGHETPLHFLPYFFNESDSSELNRAPNEFSHLAIWLEKGTNILDVPEAGRLAMLILKSIKKVDFMHFNSLCTKIDVDSNIV